MGVSQDTPLFVTLKLTLAPTPDPNRNPNASPNPNPSLKLEPTTRSVTLTPAFTLALTQDTPLFAAFAGARGLRLADGPDEVWLGV